MVGVREYTKARAEARAEDFLAREEAEEFGSRLRTLQESDVVDLGQLSHAIVSHWTAQTTDNLGVVLTGKQRLHYLTRHQETESLESLLRDAVLEPDEVHRNRRDPSMAIFYKAIDANRYVRVAVLMQAVPNWRKHSIISYRLAKAAEVRKGGDRVVWRRG